MFPRGAKDEHFSYFHSSCQLGLINYPAFRSSRSSSSGWKRHNARRDAKRVPYKFQKDRRAKFKSTEDLIHRLYVCISGAADQLQSNYAADFRYEKFVKSNQTTTQYMIYTGGSCVMLFLIFIKKNRNIQHPQFALR